VPPSKPSAALAASSVVPVAPVRAVPTLLGA